MLEVAGLEAFEIEARAQLVGHGAAALVQGEVRPEHAGSALRSLDVDGELAVAPFHAQDQLGVPGSAQAIADPLLDRAIEREAAVQGDGETSSHEHVASAKVEVAEPPQQAALVGRLEAIAVLGSHRYPWSR